MTNEQWFRGLDEGMTPGSSQHIRYRQPDATEQRKEQHMPNQWPQEFGFEYAVPREIDYLCFHGQLEDHSWHNDACPRFVNAAHTREIWCDHPEIDQRETQWPRFNVYTVSASLSVNSECLYTGDDLKAAVEALTGVTITALIANVRDYFEYRLGKHDAPVMPDAELSNYPMESVCGQLCATIIDKAVELMAVCDPHPQITQGITEAAHHAVSIVCFG